jgi:xylose isomerase
MGFTSFLDPVPDVRYDGPESDDPFAYRYYDADAQILGRPMRAWMRSAVALWHALHENGQDPFGAATRTWPWDQQGGDVETQALRRADVAFDLVTKLGLDFYTLHDRDAAPEADDPTTSEQQLQRVVEHLADLQQASGIHLLWGSCMLFKQPRYAQGASTSPSPAVFAAAAAQVKTMLECNQRLGAGTFCLWGGRDGFQSLLNVDMELELECYARFLHLIRDHARSIGFDGPLLIEPKPREPRKHQYDFDAAHVVAFLRRFHLMQDFKLNIEGNHALLAGHEFAYEIEYARINGVLGNIDANRGDPLLGWDTDQFPIDHRACALCWLPVIQQGGLAPGGLNYDAKLRRESTAIGGLVHGHIGGVDTWARGLRMEARLIEDGSFKRWRDARYEGWQTGLGRRIRDGEEDLASLHELTLQQGWPEPPPSAAQERWEQAFTRFD